MAKMKLGFYSGTAGNITFYHYQGKQCIKSKSSLDANRIKKDPAFAGFRKSSGRLAEASPIASAFYRQLKIKDNEVFREITGHAIIMIRNGMTSEQIIEELQYDYLKNIVP